MKGKGSRKDGKRNSVTYDRSDGGMRRGQGAVSMADIILWAIIESLKADGLDAAVVRNGDIQNMGEDK